jgi:tetratricopeptide (TPR) repeat protein
MPTPLSLLLTPRETLPVLQHIAANPAEPPDKAFHSMGVGVNTWYRATANLERLGLIAPDRGPAGRKVVRFHITPEGERVLARLDDLWGDVANSRAGLEWELDKSPPLKGSPRAGAVLCSLIEFAERRADFKELLRLEGATGKLARPGESALALEMLAFLQGRPGEAAHRAESAIKVLKREGNSRALRKAMYVHSAVLEYLGNPEKSIAVAIETRRLAKKAGDAGMEADAWMGIAIMHGRMEHYPDAFREFEKALQITKDAGLEAKHAKVLGNYAFIQALVDEPTGLAMADEALASARKVGATIIVARTQLTRALLLAVAGRPAEARKAMAEAQRLFKAGGEEKGAQLVKDWAGLVKRISRRRRHRSPADWKSQALALARTRPK